jgi:hypothetical protein
LTDLFDELRTHPAQTPLSDRAQLLQHSQRVKVRPCFNDLAANNVIDSDPCDGGRLVGGRLAKQTSGVGAMRCPAGHYCVTFGNLIFNRVFNSLHSRVTHITSGLCTRSFSAQHHHWYACLAQQSILPSSSLLVQQHF